MLIALAGGICSGKSAVTDILRKNGETVLVADEINASLLEDPNYLMELLRLFPAVFVGGKPDKHALRELIFNDKNARVRLNALAHPAILAKIMSLAKASGKKAVFAELPLLIESHAESYFDKIWVVHTDDAIRLKRISTRDNISESSAVKILSAQASEKAALDIADVIIENNGTLKELEQQVTYRLNELKNEL